MFGRLYVARVRMLLRERGMLFWMAVFPLILATLFNFAFSGIFAATEFAPIEVVVVENDHLDELPGFRDLLDELGKSGKDQTLDITYVADRAAGERILTDRETTGVIVPGDPSLLLVDGSWTEQTILQYILEGYERSTAVVTSAIEHDPAVLQDGTLELVGEVREYYRDAAPRDFDTQVTYYYALLAMVCLYGSFLGISAVSMSEANMSRHAMRMSVSPVHKAMLLGVGLAAGVTIHLACLGLLFAYMVWGLRIDFGDQMGRILLLMGFGSVAGQTMGILIGSALKVGEETKISISLAITMVWSMLAGMMQASVKQLVQENLPLLAKTNPVNMVADGLYSLYYYDTFTRYNASLAGLAIFSGVMLVAAYFFIRRKQYASL